MATSGRWGRWRGSRRAPRTSTTSCGLWSRKTEAAEAGALGTAICGGIGTGVHFSLDAATEQIVRVLRTHEPDPQSRDRLGEVYETDLAWPKSWSPCSRAWGSAPPWAVR